MFGPAYFGTTYFGPTYFGPSQDESGGAKKIRDHKRKKKHDLIDGLKAFYGEPETIPSEPKSLVLEPEIEKVVEDDEFYDLETIPNDFLTFKETFESLESKVEMSPETRAELERTQDIGVILAILEAVL